MPPKEEEATAKVTGLVVSMTIQLKQGNAQAQWFAATNDSILFEALMRFSEEGKQSSLV